MNSSVPSGHWVHHDGRVYTPLTVPSSDDSTAGAEWLLEIGDRSGSWTEINAGLGARDHACDAGQPLWAETLAGRPCDAGYHCQWLTDRCG